MNLQHSSLGCTLNKYKGCSKGDNFSEVNQLMKWHLHNKAQKLSCSDKSSAAMNLKHYLFPWLHTEYVNIKGVAQVGVQAQLKYQYFYHFFIYLECLIIWLVTLMNWLMRFTLIQTREWGRWICAVPPHYKPNKCQSLSHPLPFWMCYVVFTTTLTDYSSSVSWYYLPTYIFVYLWLTFHWFFTPAWFLKLLI